MRMEGFRKTVLRWFYPEPLTSFRGVWFHRCMEDGALITREVPKDILALHAGHRLTCPTTLKWREKLLIWARILR